MLLRPCREEYLDHPHSLIGRVPIAIDRFKFQFPCNRPQDPSLPTALQRADACLRRWKARLTPPACQGPPPLPEGSPFQFLVSDEVYFQQLELHMRHMPKPWLVPDDSERRKGLTVLPLGMPASDPREMYPLPKARLHQLRNPYRSASDQTALLRAMVFRPDPEQPGSAPQPFYPKEQIEWARAQVALQETEATGQVAQQQRSERAALLNQMLEASASPPSFHAPGTYPKIGPARMPVQSCVPLGPGAYPVIKSGAPPPFRPAAVAKAAAAAPNVGPGTNASTGDAAPMSQAAAPAGQQPQPAGPGPSGGSSTAPSTSRPTAPAGPRARDDDSEGGGIVSIPEPSSSRPSLSRGPGTGSMLDLATAGAADRGAPQLLTEGSEAELPHQVDGVPMPADRQEGEDVESQPLQQPTALESQPP